MNKRENLLLPFSHLFSKMATLSVKPGQRFTVPDWHTNSHLISADAERQRSASHQVRQEARSLRNKTSNQVSLPAAWLLPGLSEQRAEEYRRVSRSGCVDTGTGESFTSTEPAKYVPLLAIKLRAMMPVYCHEIPGCDSCILCNLCCFLCSPFV